MATKIKRPPELWTADNAATAAAAGWSLEWVIAPSGKVLCLEPFSSDGSVTPFELRTRLHAGAKRGNELCIAAMRALVHSKIN